MLPDSPRCIVITAGACTLLADTQTKNMKLGGFLLLLSGWGIVIAAIALLHGHMVARFIYAGLAVEILGLVLVFRGHLSAAVR